MSKKFTGITSAGSAIPVYDKDAHSALEQKLDTSAFSSVSGDFLTEVPESAVSGFATHEEVESATSGAFPASAVSPLVNSIFANTVEYRSKPESGEIYAAANNLYNVNSIAGKSWNIQSAQLYLNGIIHATSDGITANGLTANTAGLTASGLSANADSAWGGFSANGISAGPRTNFAIRGQGESLTSMYGNGFVFSSVNTGIGTAQLTTAPTNTYISTYSPKFEARNVSGAGFSIEASGARGYDSSGNVVWDTHKPPKLIGWANYQGTAIDPRASGINGGIIATVYPDNIPQSMQLSSAPYTYMNGNGFYEQVPGTLSSTVDANGFSFKHSQYKVTAAMTPGDVSFAKYNTATSATDVWSLIGSVQKREIECDSATSAITAIAGSAIGGKEYSAGANIDITDEVISGKDWTDEIIAATSGLQPSGDYLSASESANFYPMTGNPSGFLTEHQSLDGYLQNSDLTIVDNKITEISGVPLSAGDELPESVSAATDYISATSGDINATIDNVSSNSGAWGGNALPISARDGLDLEMSGDMLWIGASALNETLSGKQDTLTFEYNESSAISAINGSALAGGGGGGDVPEGVMAESGLGFNAIDEISGYNGSAFATLSPEKQWLVHDDTLVHAANSAQYALGVNVSAVQTLMGMMGPKLEEPTLAGYWNGHEVKQMLLTGTFSTNVNSDVIPVNSAYSAYERKWIDPSNSFIFYGSSANVLPTTWVLGATDRLGSLSLLNGIVRARSNDTAQTTCTAFVTIKWCEM